jgi:hypothetical protein
MTFSSPKCLTLGEQFGNYRLKLSSRNSDAARLMIY